MFTGALAASYYGVPRTTMDVDIVVKIALEDLETGLVSILKRVGLQVSGGSVDAAFKSGFRIVTFRDRETPFTLDIILSGKKLEKNAGGILGLPTFYQTPEDLILAKLRMVKATIPRERALKDEDDVKAILKFTKVDVKALKRRAQRERTLSIFEALVAH